MVKKLKKYFFMNKQVVLINKLKSIGFNNITFDLYKYIKMSKQMKKTSSTHLNE